MPENDNHIGPDLPAIILSRPQVEPLHAKLIEDQYGAYGIPYDFETQFPNPPERQDPSRELDVDTMIVTKYRAAILTHLLQTGSIGYLEARDMCRERGVTMPFILEAFREAYQDVLDHVNGKKKLPNVKKEES